MDMAEEYCNSENPVNPKQKSMKTNPYSDTLWRNHRMLNTERNLKST